MKINHHNPSRNCFLTFFPFGGENIKSRFFCRKQSCFVSVWIEALGKWVSFHFFLNFNFAKYWEIKEFSRFSILAIIWNRNKIRTQHFLVKKIAVLFRSISTSNNENMKKIQEIKFLGVVESCRQWLLNSEKKIKNNVKNSWGWKSEKTPKNLEHSAEIQSYWFL